MQERGHQIVLAVMKGGELAKRARDKGFSVYEIHFQKSRWPFTFWKLVSIIKNHRIDLINTHSSLDSWIGGIAGRWMGVKIVRTRHLSTPIKPGWNSRTLYGRLADFVVTTCASIIPSISRQSGKSLKLCLSVPTGIDPIAIQVSQEEAEAFRKQYNIPSDALLVGTACFMRSWKGIQDFLKAADLLRDYADVAWIIIGGGHAETYKQMAKDLSLENRVIFTGHLDHPFPALKALDLFALLSTAHEGVSQAILQAAFLGKPLIATVTGGLGEVCIDRQTGLSVDPFSPEQVARAVLELKNNPDLKLKWGDKARSLVMERFIWQTTLDQMERVFMTLGSEKVSEKKTIS